MFNVKCYMSFVVVVNKCIKSKQKYRFVKANKQQLLPLSYLVDDPPAGPCPHRSNTAGDLLCFSRSSIVVDHCLPEDGHPGTGVTLARLILLLGLSDLLLVLKH